MTQYIAVTPVKDEEINLPRLISCFVRQSHRPLMWYIIDDGSQDKSADIIRALVAQYSWCKMISMPARAKRARGKAVVNAIMEAVNDSQYLEYIYMAKVDADVTFPENLFQTIIERMDNNSMLGISGPELLAYRNSKWELERVIPIEFVRGPIRVYKRECFQNINGLIPRKGWDGIDLVKAQVNGWEVKRFADLRAFSHREIGEATGFVRAAIENGRGSYFMGSTFLYLLSEAIEFGKQKPYFIKGFFMIVGYLIGFVKSDRIDDKEVIEFIRCQHKTLIKNKLKRVWL